MKEALSMGSSMVGGHLLQELGGMMAHSKRASSVGQGECSGLRGTPILVNGRAIRCMEKVC